MALIHPIRPLIYQAKDNHDISGLIAPPYDVLDEDAKAALLSKNGRNFVAVDLPHLPAKTVGPDEAYEQAGNRFRQWLDDGVMGLYPKRQFFVYRQTFQLLGHGARYQRMGLFAGVAVQRLGESKPGHGGIYPHEETFSGPKEDRLKLMRTTRSSSWSSIPRRTCPRPSAGTRRTLRVFGQNSRRRRGKPPGDPK